MVIDIAVEKLGASQMGQNCFLLCRKNKVRDGFFQETLNG